MLSIKSVKIPKTHVPPEPTSSCIITLHRCFGQISMHQLNSMEFILNFTNFILLLLTFIVFNMFSFVLGFFVKKGEQIWLCCLLWFLSYLWLLHGIIFYSSFFKCCLLFLTESHLTLLNLVGQGGKSIRSFQFFPVGITWADEFRAGRFSRKAKQNKQSYKLQSSFRRKRKIGLDVVWRARMANCVPLCFDVLHIGHII